MSADGSVRIKIEADDSQLKKAEGSVKSFTASMMLVKVAEVAFRAIADAMDNAISRFDTLNQFPRVLEGIGFGAEESERAISDLSDGIQGLPTTLDGIADVAKGIALITKDIDLAVDITLAMNNAFLASGASADEASRGMDQYSKMLSTGEVNLMSWRTLMETMGPAMDDVAHALGFTGPSAMMDLYQAMKDGKIPMSDFNDAMVEADQAVGGFADRALEGSEGIATSMQNIKTAVSTGVERVIRSFDEMTKAITGKNIAQNMRGLQMVIADLFKAIAKGVGYLTPLVSGLVKVLGGLISVMEFLEPAIVGVVVAYTAWVAIMKVKGIIEKNTLALEALGVVNEIVASSIKAKTTATELETVATAMSTGVITAKQIAIGILSGQITIATGLTALWTKATVLLNGALAFLATPIGIIVAVIAVATGLFVALNKSMKNTSEEANKLTGEFDGLMESSEDLIKSSEDSERAYEKQGRSMEANSAFTRELMEDTVALTQQEKLSNEEKKQLEANISELNTSVDNLNLSYNEETEALSLTIEQMKERQELQEAEEKYSSIIERQNELKKEDLEIEVERAEIAKIVEEARKRASDMDNTTMADRKAYNTLINESLARDEELAERQEMNAVSRQAIADQEIESAQAVADAEAEAVGQRIESYAHLNEAQQGVVDKANERIDELVEANFNGLKKIEQNEMQSAEEIADIHRHNVEVLEEMAIARVEAVEKHDMPQALLNQLDTMGPQAKLIYDDINAMTEEEFVEWSETFRTGTENAVDKAVDELGLSKDLLAPGVYEMLGPAEQAWIDGLDASSIGLGLDEKIEEGVNEGKPRMFEAGWEATQEVEEGVISGTEGVNLAGVNIGYAVGDGTAQALEEDKPLMFEAGYESATSVEDGVIAGTEGVNIAGIELGKSTVATPKDEITEGATSMYDAGKSVAEGVEQGIIDGTEGVAEASRGMGTGVDEAFRSQLQIHSPSQVFVQHGADIIAGLISGIQQGRVPLMDHMRLLGQDMNRAMTDSLATLTIESGSSMDGFINGIMTTTTRARIAMLDMQSTMQTATTGIVQVWTILEANNRSIWTSMSATILTSSAQMYTTTQIASNNIDAVWRTMLSQMDRNTRSGFASMVSGMQGQFSIAISNARSASSGVVNNLNAGISGARSAGVNMGIGFRVGLASTESSIMSTARGIANSASNAIKSALDINSPSGVSMKLGEFFGEGFVVGMDSMLKGVEKSGQNLANSAVPKVNTMGSFGRISGGSAGVISRTSNNSRVFNINIENIENNADTDIPKVLSEAVWIMDREESRLDG